MFMFLFNSFRIFGFILLLIANISYAAEKKDSIRLFVDNNAKRVLDVLAGKYNDAEKQDKLAVLFHDIVDAEWMAKFAIAKHWLVMNAAQQKDYLDAYKSYITKSYVRRFTEYNGQKYSIATITKLNMPNQYLAVTEIISSNPSKPQIEVSYRIKVSDSKMHVIDIIGEGISLLATQRADFSATISSQGINNFIKTLKAKS